MVEILSDDFGRLVKIFYAKEGFFKRDNSQTLSYIVIFLMVLWFSGSFAAQRYELGLYLWPLIITITVFIGIWTVVSLPGLPMSSDSADQIYAALYELDNCCCDNDELRRDLNRLGNFIEELASKRSDPRQVFFFFTLVRATLEKHPALGGTQFFRNLCHYFSQSAECQFIWRHGEFL